MGIDLQASWELVPGLAAELSAAPTCFVDSVPGYGLWGLLGLPRVDHSSSEVYLGSASDFSSTSSKGRMGTFPCCSFGHGRDVEFRIPLISCICWVFKPFDAI